MYLVDSLHSSTVSQSLYHTVPEFVLYRGWISHDKFCHAHTVLYNRPLDLLYSTDLCGGQKASCDIYSVYMTEKPSALHIDPHSTGTLYWQQCRIAHQNQADHGKICGMPQTTLGKKASYLLVSLVVCVL